VKTSPQSDFATIPAELKVFTRWVNWRSVVRDGKPTKVPLDPKTGGRASCSDPATWGTYEQALARFARGGIDGVGFQLGSPYCGIDLDLCRDRATGDIEPRAQEVINRLDSYTEISPSGTGVHVLVKGSLPPRGRRKGHVEIYSGGRFLTVTGDHVGGTPTTVEHRQVALDGVHAQIFGAGKPSPATAAVAGPSASLSDTEIIERANNAKNGAKFARLWGGDYTEYDSHSEADLALCIMLAFWTGRDAQRIDSLFRRSKLFRPKWDERHAADGRTYGGITVEKAVENTQEVWNSPVAAIHGGSAGGNSRPKIIYSNRQLHDVTCEAVDVLQASNASPFLFVRSGQIARVRNDEESRPIIDAVGQMELRSRLASVSDGVRYRESGEEVNCPPRLDVIQNVLALGEWPFPALQGITETPVLRPDWTIVDTPGYDARTRLLYLPAPSLAVPDVPEEPTDLNVEAALDFLVDVIGDFPFVDESSKANALAMMLTTVVRPAIKGRIPLALVDAPQAGTGKGLLTEAIGIIATGRQAAMMPAPKDEDEWRKRITAILLGGSTVVIIDNVEHAIESPAFAAALTAGEWSDRFLGLSKMVTIPVRATWIVTGNNIILGGDLARRCYWVRLDAKTARPWKRTGFKRPNLLSWVAQNRGEILAALLILARAWFVAGKPDFKVPVVGGFDEWAQVVGGVLGFAGVTGFLKNLDGLYDRVDESSVQWEGFLQFLTSKFEDASFTVKRVAEIAQYDSECIDALPDDIVVTDGDGDFQRRLGKAFSKREGRRFGDRNFHLEKAGMKSRAVKWRVRRG
jgi:hypothetical protein